MMVSGRAGIYRLIACWWLGFMLIFVVIGKVPEWYIFQPIIMLIIVLRQSTKLRREYEQDVEDAQWVLTQEAQWKHREILIPEWVGRDLALRGVRGPIIEIDESALRVSMRSRLQALILQFAFSQVRLFERGSELKAPGEPAKAHPYFLAAARRRGVHREAARLEAWIISSCAVVHDEGDPTLTEFEVHLFELFGLGYVALSPVPAESDHYMVKVLEGAADPGEIMALPSHLRSTMESLARGLNVEMTSGSEVDWRFQ